jgi:hypothetical protein
MTPNPRSEDWSDYDEAPPEEARPTAEVVRWYAHPPMRYTGVLFGLALAGAFILGAFAGTNTTRARYWVRSKMPRHKEHPTKH